MNVYLDSSIVVRRLRREAGDLTAWGNWENAYASVLLRVETLRTIDRLRLAHAASDANVRQLLKDAQTVFAAVHFVPIANSILVRAAQSFLTPVGTLDALHLATALRLVESEGLELTFATHDTQLALAAQSVQLPVIGV